MIPYDPRIDEYLKRSHTMIAKVELWGESGYIRDLVLVDGNVRVDDKDIRRRCSIQITDEDYKTEDRLTPDDLTNELLAPTGNELRVYRGVRILLEDYWVLLGVFSIDDVRTDSSGDGHQIHIDGYDRARKIQRAKLNRDYVITAGTNVVDAIKTLVSNAYPGVFFYTESTVRVTPKIVMEIGADPWAKCRELAKSIGFETYFSENGTCVIRQVVEDPTDPVWEYDVEKPDNILMYVNKRLQNNTVYNHVVVTGESTEDDAVYYGEAFDNNPLSPTYVYGRFGDVVLHEASSHIRSDDQAQEMAQALLTKHMGIAEEVNTISVVHPAHEVGDVIRLYFPEAGVSGSYVIDALTIPLVAQRALNIKCRQRLLTS